MYRGILPLRFAVSVPFSPGLIPMKLWKSADKAFFRRLKGRRKIETSKNKILWRWTFARRGSCGAAVYRMIRLGRIKGKQPEMQDWPEVHIPMQSKG